jgi:hypothetical protein
MRSQVGARRINCHVAARTTSRSISFSSIRSPPKAAWHVESLGDARLGYVI